MPVARAQVVLDIARPPEIVFDMLSDYDQNVRWQEGVVRSERVGGADPAPGVVVRYVRTLAGRELETEAEMLEVVRPSTLRIKSTNRLFSYIGGYDLAAEGEGTRLRYGGEITTSRLLGPVGKLVAQKFQSQMEGDLARLKTLLESEGPAQA